MTAQTLVAIITGGVGALAGAAGAYVALKRDKRDTAAQTVELLEKQIEVLEKALEESKRQGEQRENEWRKRESDWKRREEKLEERVHDLERDYRNLVLTVTTMGFCANSATCPTYNPGDRREHPK